MDFPVTQQTIVHGLRSLGLDRSSSVIVHASLSSFGLVEGGATSVCRALVQVCGTVVVPASSWDLTGIPAPPGLKRPHNAVSIATSWQEFDQALANAVPYSPDLPIDQELGRIPETMRRAYRHARSPHPLVSFLAVGERADQVIGAQTLGQPLGPIAALEELGGKVVLLGVTHTSNTAIHLAEQRLGRSCFWRYAKAAEGVWMELPNIPGDSQAFDEIEPLVSDVTREVHIGACRARSVGVTDVLSAATRLIDTDPWALMPRNAASDSRAADGVRQRLSQLENGTSKLDG
jgi:aminoglycoside 3-N-acetyltransferase